MQFLEASAEARRQQEEQRRSVRTRRLRHVTALLAATSLLAIFLLGVILMRGYLYSWKYVAYYKTFDKRYGVPRGIGDLKDSDVKHRPVSFEITRKGKWGPLLTIRAINGLGEPTTDHNVGTYLRFPSESGQQAETPTRECRWDFVYDEQHFHDQAGNEIDHVVYEVARDRLGKMVWGLIYSPTADIGQAPPCSRKGHFVGPDGYPQPQRHSETEYVEIHYDKSGFEATLKWTDRKGKAMPGPDNAYGRVREFDPRGLCVRETSVNEHGNPMVDAAGNATMESNMIPWATSSLPRPAMRGIASRASTPDGHPPRRVR